MPEYKPQGCKIAHARIDERGRSTGGVAGDQNGKELEISAYYKHSKCGDEGWRVFRPRHSVIAGDIATAAELAVRNPNIGYDQKQRGTLFDRLDANGFDMASITEPCECDCSSLVHACLWAAGIPVGEIFRTAAMPYMLMQTGEFFELSGDDYRKSGQYLLRGDIIVTPRSGHTAIVVEDGNGAVIEKNRPEWRTVTATGVWNIRDAIPASCSINPINIVATVRYGDIVRYYGEKGEWAGVKVGNKKGFVSTKAFK